MTPTFLTQPGPGSSLINEAWNVDVLASKLLGTLGSTTVMLPSLVSLCTH